MFSPLYVNEILTALPFSVSVIELTTIFLGSLSTFVIFWGVAFIVANPIVFAELIAVTVKVYSVSFESELKV